MIELTIDGKPCACEKGETLLAVARRYRIQIPSLCYHEGLCAQGVCRVCMVEIVENGWRRLVASCIFPVQRPMEVFTNSESVQKHRDMVLSLLLARAPAGERVGRLARYYKVSVPKRMERQTGEKCVLCGLCVRACESIGTGAISTVNRGITKAVDTPYSEPSAPCIGCASCAMVCPTDVINVEESGNTRTIWGKTFELAQCESCGQAFATKEHAAYAARAAELEQSCLCPDCRKKSIALGMRHTFGT